jgi:hypothetical protein
MTASKIAVSVAVLTLIASDIAQHCAKRAIV